MLEPGQASPTFELPDADMQPVDLSASTFDAERLRGVAAGLLEGVYKTGPGDPLYDATLAPASEPRLRPASEAGRRKEAEKVPAKEPEKVLAMA